MAYAAVASLLQTLDFLMKYLSSFFELMKIEGHGLRGRKDSVTMPGGVLQLTEENQRVILESWEIQVAELQGALLDLSTFSWEEDVTVEECETECSSNVEISDSNREPPPNGEVDLMKLLHSTSVHPFFRETVEKWILDYLTLKKSLYFYGDVYKQVRILYRNLCFLLTYLDHSSNISEALLKRIRDVSDKSKYVIEDSIFLYQMHSLLIQMIFDFEMGRTRGRIYAINIVCYRNESIRGSLAEAREEIKAIIKVEIKREDRSTSGKVLSVKSSKISPRERKEEIVVGLDDEPSMLERLTDKTRSGLEIVAIVGMGGIGKTTLAKKLFNNPYIAFQFDCRAWITVSQVYDVRDLLLGLLSIFVQRSDKLIQKSNAELSEDLKRSLKGKKYLIVMDDMWSIDAWNDVERCFPDDKTASRIMVTSRSVELAHHLNPNKPPHFMNLLDTDKSWELLQKLVCRDEICSSELDDVGRQIAKRCRGLPLAVVLVAGILSRAPRTLDSWAHVIENLGHMLARGPEQCLDILALSYIYLPHKLRACFLYMGAFPEDCEIEVQKLISLWVAEGFLHSESSGDLEQIAEEYLEDLIGRNLVMIEKKDFGGKVKRCRLHDFVRELCLREAQKENLIKVVRRQSRGSDPVGLRNQRRISFHIDPYCDVPAAPALPQVSSFLCFSLGLDIVPDILFFQLGFKLLRVLDMYFLRFEYFPERILALIHLRYLALNVTFELPATMYQLRNLQTFVIQGPCPTFLLRYWRMPSLRHLRSSVPIELEDPFIYRQYFQRLFALKDLQTVSVLRFSSCRKKVFTAMPGLKRLKICETTDDYRTDRSYDFLKNLVYLQKLETLKCCFYSQNREARRISCLDAFPSTLRQLTLSWSYLPWEDMTTIARLPNVEVLKLKNYAFQGPRWLQTDECFSSLKYLLIDNTNLVLWEATVHQYPRLQKLILKHCKHLEEIPFGIDAIGSLNRMEVHYCSYPIEVLAKDFQEQVEGVDVAIRSHRSHHNVH